MKSQTFGEKIKQLREEQKYTLKYVGEQINYSASSISKIEKNLKKAPERILQPLSRLLSIEYKDLLIKYLSENVYYSIKEFDYAKEVLEVALNRFKKEGKGTRELRRKEDIINSIRLYLGTKPIEKAWIFGSFARDSQVSYDSDIDILVQFKKPNKITLFDLIEMKDELAKETGREIDLVEAGQELKSFTKEIQKEKRLVYAA